MERSAVQGTCITCKYLREAKAGVYTITVCVSNLRDLKKDPKTGLLKCWEPKEE